MKQMNLDSKAIRLPTIMLVDDDPVNLKLLSIWLTKLSEKVVACTSADEALEKFATTHPDLLISDIQMQGKSGLELAKLIKDQSPHFPVILMTAYGNQQDLLSALNLGTDYFLLKPVDRDTLERYVEKLSQAQQTREALAVAQAEILEKNHILEALRQTELEVGAGIQQLILYRPPPEKIQGIACAYAIVPAQMVNGDFLDHFVLSEHCVDFVIGDAMGKGLTAGLLAAGVKTGLMRALTHLKHQTKLHSNVKFLPINQIIEDLYEETYSALIRLDSFVTMLYLRVNTESAQIEWIDCGHSKIILQRAHQTKCILLNGDNVPLGILANQTFKARDFYLLPDDRIYLLTDGLTEVRQENNQQLDLDGIVSLIKQQTSQALPQVVTSVIEKVREFAEKSGQYSDDKTMLGISMQNLSTKYTFVSTQVSAALANLPIMRSWLQDQINRYLAIVKANTNSQNNFTDWLDAFILGATECMANVLRHALNETSDDIDLTLIYVPNGLQLEILYSGKKFEPSNNREEVLDELREGSYGLYLIDTLFDKVEYYTDNCSNQAIILRKLLET